VREQLEANVGADGVGGGDGLSPFASTYVLSAEQLRAWRLHGCLMVRDALLEATVASLSSMADGLASLPTSGGEEPWLVHHEQTAKGEVNICRVENFCHHLPGWGTLAFGVVQDLVSQAFGERAVLFKDKLNFKGPGGGGFLLHQDATAYATEELASRHISVRLAVDESTLHNGPLEVARGRHDEGILQHVDGVIDEVATPDLVFDPVLVSPGGLVLFDSYLPHRSHANQSNSWRRSAYLTYNRASEGDLHAAYYAKKRTATLAGRAGAISINKDFGGRVVAPPAGAAAAATA